MDKKVVVIFIEGDSEVEFYNQFLAIIREYIGGKFDCCVEVENASGIGNYKKKVISTFEKRIKSKYPKDAHFYIVLCYDKDAFVLNKNPPVNWTDVKKSFKDKGAKRVYQVEAKYSIEDWFLYDTQGVLKYLALPKSTKIPKIKGQAAIQALFKKANKLYIKGAKNSEFVQALNLKIILARICQDIKPLCMLLGSTCKDNTICLYPEKKK